MAMTSSIDDLISTLCPDLAASPGLDVYLDIAKGNLSLEALGDSYNLAVALRAAHEYTVDATRAGGQGGKVVSMTEGRTSVQYEATNRMRSSSALEMTQYGTRLKTLFRTLGLVASGV